MDHRAFQLATVMPIIAKSMSPANPNKIKSVVWLIETGKASPKPKTRKLTPSVIVSQRPIRSMILDECFRLELVNTSLLGLEPNRFIICLLNTPMKIVTIPRINQIENMVLPPLRIYPAIQSVHHTYQNIRRKQ